MSYGSLIQKNIIIIARLNIPYSFARLNAPVLILGGAFIFAIKRFARNIAFNNDYGLTNTFNYVTF